MSLFAPIQFPEFHFCVTTLSKLFTHMYLCRQTAKWYLAGGMGDITRSLQPPLPLIMHQMHHFKIKFLLMAKSPPSLVSTTNTTLFKCEYSYSVFRIRLKHFVQSAPYKYTLCSKKNIPVFHHHP